MRKQLLGSTSVGFGLLLGGAILAFDPAPALAVCAGAVTGGPDNISCTGNNDGVNINTIGGEDTIVIEAGGTRIGNAGDSTIAGGQDNDTLRVNAGSIFGFAAGSSGTLEGDAGEDVIRVLDSDIGRLGDALLHGGTGNDTIRFLDGSRLGVLDGGTGTLDGGGGDDLIIVDDSDIGRAGIGIIEGGTGNDLIRIRNGSALAHQATGSATVSGQAADDTIVVQDSLIGREGDATIRGDAGSDIIRIWENSILGHTATGSALVDGGTGNDTINVDMSTIGRLGTATVEGGAGEDDIRIRNGSVVAQLDGSTATIDGQNGADLININGSILGGAGDAIVRGGAENDTIQVFNGSTVGDAATGSGTIEGNDGDDTIVVVDSMLGRAGSGTVDGGEGNDRIVVDNSDIGRIGDGLILGNDGEDSIEVRNGSTLGFTAGSNGEVRGGEDNDTIIFDDAIVGRLGNGTLRGDDGNDTITLRNGSVVGFGAGSTGQVEGDSGDDIINIDNSTIGRLADARVRGDGNDDQINVTNGSIIGQSAGVTGQILGDSGDDTLTIDNATLGLNGDALVAGGSDNDTIAIQNGSVLARNAGSSAIVNGQTGDDVITASDSRIGVDGTATLRGADGNDVITLAGTTHLNATAMVLGDGDDDTVNLFDTVTADAGATLDGGAGTMDNLVLDGTGTGLFDGTITQQNFEMLTKQGSGTWTWAQNAAFSGGASIDNGIFELNAILTADTYIAGPATMTGTGQVTGNVDNDGTVSPAGMGTIGSLTFDGDYDGGGTLALDTVIGASGSPSDLLVITGTVSGVTMVEVTDFGGGTPQFTGDGPGNGILLVDVSAGSTNADDFALSDGPIDVGFFRYELNLESDDNWYLQSTDLSPAGYDAGEGLAGMLSAAQDQVRSDIGIAHNRVQTLRLYEGGSAAQTADAGGTQLASLLASNGGSQARGSGVGVWIEGFGRDANLDPKGHDDFDQTTWGGQIGIDGEVAENVYLGAVAGYANSDLDFDGADGDIESYTLGAYAAYIDGGFYIDGVVKGGWLDFDNSSGGESEDYDGWLAGAAVKTGYAVPLGESVAIEPNAGLTWVHVDHDDFTFGTVSVDEESEDSLQGRLGLRLSGTWSTGAGGSFSPYVEAGVSHEFMADNEIEFTGVEFESDMGGTSFDVGGGLTAVFDGGVAVSAGVTYTGGEHIDAIQGNLGVGLRF